MITNWNSFVDKRLSSWPVNLQYRCNQFKYPHIPILIWSLSAINGGWGIKRRVGIFKFCIIKLKVFRKATFSKSTLTRGGGGYLKEGWYLQLLQRWSIFNQHCVHNYSNAIFNFHFLGKGGP